MPRKYSQADVMVELSRLGIAVDDADLLYFSAWLVGDDSLVSAPRRSNQGVEHNTALKWPVTRSINQPIGIHYGMVMNYACEETEEYPEHLPKPLV